MTQQESPANLISDPIQSAKTWAFFFLYEGTLTGGPKRALDTALAASKQGMHCILVSNCENPITDAFAQRGLKYHLLDIPASLGRRQGKALTLHPSRLWGIRNDIRYVARQIRDCVDEWGIDGWWSRGIKAVLMARQAARQRKIPLIWDMGAEYKSRGLAAAVHVLGFQSCTRSVAQGNHVLTQTFPHWMRRWFGHKFQVFIPGLDPERIARLQRASTPYNPSDPITIIGTVNSRKNQRLLIDSCNALFRTGHDFKVRLVGPSTDDEYQANCRLACQEFEARYQWVGWSDQIAQIMAQSSAIAICSKQEGLPQTVLEAMHASRPVISVPVGGVPDLITHGVNGFLAENTDVESLSTAIECFLSCPADKLSTICESATETVRTRANQETWEQDYAQFLQSLTR